MILNKLSLTQFKSYIAHTIEPSPGINVIYGNNGTGKTNLLDAIFFLSFGKSHFNLSDNALVKDGEDYYRLEGSFSDGDKIRLIVVAKFKNDQRKIIAINGKKIKQVRDLIGRVPVVLIAPDDLTIVHGGSKERRDFINRILCQSDQEYLSAILHYNRLLRQKDALLKRDHTPSHLEVRIYNEQMVTHTQAILQKRQSEVDKIRKLVQRHYADISVRGEEIGMQYETQLKLEELPAQFENILQQEIRSRRPLIGVQRDDIFFTIGGKPFKKFASQGQLKTLLYSLRMAEFFYLDKLLGTKPILLLDDYFEKLDQNRLSALLNLIQGDDFKQVFVTDTELNRSKKILEEHQIQYKAFEIQ